MCIGKECPNLQSGQDNHKKTLKFSVQIFELFHEGDSSFPAGDPVPLSRSTPGGRVRHWRRWSREIFPCAKDRRRRRRIGTNFFRAGDGPRFSTARLSCEPKLEFCFNHQKPHCLSHFNLKYIHNLKHHKFRVEYSASYAREGFKSHCFN